MTAKMPAAVCLMGPTASGKTGLAISLASSLPFEIVSVDSALVYRGMDIGTAKPSIALRQQIPHHLVDIRDPLQTYSAADFRRDALVAMAEITERGRVPLLVGGTMLYFKALRDGLANLPSANVEVRSNISEIAEREGWPEVHKRLAKVDPTSAARINPNDPQRLQRALEIYEVSGQSMTELLQSAQTACPFRLCEIALVPGDRSRLHEAISVRFGEMIEAGLIDEVRALMARGDLSPALPAIRAVGYRQVWAHLKGELTRAEMQERACAATRQLAKRQLTWLRSWPGLSVIERPETDSVLKILQSASILA